MTFQQQCERCPVVAILRGITPDEITDVCETLREAGIRLLEVPLNSPDALESIRRAAREYHAGTELLIGAGTGLIIKSHATSGGTDIIAKLLTRYAHIRFSRGILIVDSCVVLFGMIVLGDWRLPLYSLVTIFVSSRVIDYILDGASYDKLLFIVSDRREQIREYILERMGRGGTYLKASGLYTARDKEVIFVVVSRGEVSMVRSMVHEIDPTAFVVIVDADETYGDGFKPFPQKE